jgi:acyl carrier protein
MSIDSAIRGFIGDQLVPDVASDEIPDDYDLVENGILDSLALVRLIAWIGETYAVPVDDLDLAPDDFRTVAAIRDFVTRHATGDAA